MLVLMSATLPIKQKKAHRSTDLRERSMHSGWTAHKPTSAEYTCAQHWTDILPPSMAKQNPGEGGSTGYLTSTVSQPLVQSSWDLQFLTSKYSVVYISLHFPLNEQNLLYFMGLL